MRWRPGHLVLILFQAFWLNVVVPGHTRGSVQLMGGPTSPSGLMACLSGASCCRPLSGGDKSHPVPSSKGHGCAICSFAAQLSVPPAVISPPPPPMPLACVAQERRDSLIARVTLRPFDSCGPPVHV